MMATRSYARKISDAEVMVSGLTNNSAQVSKRGLEKTFIDNLSANTTMAIKLNNEQEKLKAQLKAKTAELDAKMAEIEKAYAEAKKIVKIEFPKEQWKEFGIEDKR